MCQKINLNLFNLSPNKNHLLEMHCKTMILPENMKEKVCFQTLKDLWPFVI